MDTKELLQEILSRLGNIEETLAEIKKKVDYSHKKWFVGEQNAKEFRRLCEEIDAEIILHINGRQARRKHVQDS